MSVQHILKLKANPEDSAYHPVFNQKQQGSQRKPGATHTLEYMVKSPQWKQI